MFDRESVDNLETQAVPSKIIVRARISQARDQKTFCSSFFAIIRTL